MMFSLLGGGGESKPRTFLEFNTEGGREGGRGVFIGAADFRTMFLFNLL